MTVRTLVTCRALSHGASTYFEGQMEAVPKARHGYSRDKRNDCKQVVVAVVMTTEGFPLAYEVMAGNTSDKTTLKEFIQKIEKQYGKAERIWVMDRGIPTEETLKEMRESIPPVGYLVGTPRARWQQFEKQLLDLPWEKIRESIQVKVFTQEGEVYVLAKSEGRRAKEVAMRRRRLAKLLRTLRALRREKKVQIKRDTLLLKLGAARKEAGRAWGFVKITLPKARQEVSPETFAFQLQKEKLEAAELRDGHYLLRGFRAGDQGPKLWDFYMQLSEIEGAFKCLKSDLRVRPIYHQKEDRIEAHIFIAFLAYCLTVTLEKHLQAHAPGLTPRAVLEKLSTILMIEVHLPLEDGRKLILPRYTQPEAEHRLVLEKLGLQLPKQPPPRIRAAAVTKTNKKEKTSDTIL